MNRPHIAAIAACATLPLSGAAAAHPLQAHIAEAAGMASSAMAGLLHP